jgi:hypothetical protein
MRVTRISTATEWPFTRDNSLCLRLTPSRKSRFPANNAANPIAQANAVSLRCSASRAASLATNWSKQGRQPDDRLDWRYLTRCD